MTKGCNFTAQVTLPGLLGKFMFLAVHFLVLSNIVFSILGQLISEFFPPQPFLQMIRSIHGTSLDRDKSDGVKSCSKADLIVIKSVRLRRSGLIKWKEQSKVFPDIKVRTHCLTKLLMMFKADTSLT